MKITIEINCCAQCPWVDTSQIIFGRYRRCGHHEGPCDDLENAFDEIHPDCPFLKEAK